MFLDIFPNFFLMIIAAILLLVDGALLHTGKVWAHRLGIKVRERRSPADEARRGALEPEVVQIADQLGVTALEDGSLSAWSDRAHFGFAYGGFAKFSDPSKRRMGVPITSHVSIQGDELVTSTYLRFGPLSMVLAFALAGFSPDMPWFVPLVGLAMGGAFYVIVTLVCARSLKGVHELADAIVGASSIPFIAAERGAEEGVSFDFDAPAEDNERASAREVVDHVSVGP